jgi:hydroxyacylglutathione hydrolase
LIAHRQSREAEILHHLDAAPDGLSIPTLTRLIYTDAPKGLMAAAARNVFAHLIDLHSRARVQADPTLSLTALFAPR